MDEDIIKNFIEEQKTEQRLNELYKSTVINFDNYFKYSGEIELSVPLYKFESYNTMKSPFKTNRRCHDIHTIMLKKNM